MIYINKYNKLKEKMRMREERGITLVALIITIVIMLILLTVGIGYVENNNLINQSESSVNKINNKTSQEQTFSNELMEVMNNL